MPENVNPIDTGLILQVAYSAGIGASLFLFIYFLLVPEWQRAKQSRSVRGWIVVVGAMGGVVTLLIVRGGGSAIPSIDWTTAFLLGGAVGIGELLTRYRDAPTRALISGAGGVYVLVNAGASVGALALARTFGWFAPVTGVPPEASDFWTQVLTAGFGSMAVLRSSLFVVKSGGEDVAVGPSALMTALLDAADRGVDRRRAEARAAAAAELISNLSPEKALMVLPDVFFALMQNLSSDNRLEIREKVTSIEQLSVPPRVKLLCFCALAMTYVGENVVRAAVIALDAEIREPAPAPASENPPEAVPEERAQATPADSPITDEDVKHTAEKLTAIIDASAPPDSGATQPKKVGSRRKQNTTGGALEIGEHDNRQTSPPAA
jgi:hypothetical protein